MSAAEPDLPILRRLASMPFLDRLELAAVSGTADRSAYAAVSALERRGLAASVIHASDLLRATRRYWLTAAGLRRLAEAEGIAPDELLRAYPVSAQRRRILMERLDGVAVIYRLASSIAAECGPVGLRWYGSAPLDAVITLPGGRIVGVVRQGLTSDRTGFSKRLWRLREGPLPGVVFMLMTDQVRLRHARRLLDGSPVSALLALERDAVLAGPAEPVWRLPSVAASLDLRYVLSSYVASRGVLPTEPAPLRASLPEDIDMESPVTQTSDWLLPALLKPAEKRVLDLLYDWPGIAPEHVRGLLGVSRARFYEIMAPLTEAGLVRRVVMKGRRLALSDRGLALLARRDRASVGAARKRWSVEPIHLNGREAWRNVPSGRSRQLLRNVEHTAAVHSIHVLAEGDVAVLLCVVPERPQLGGDGQVHVLAVAGDSGVEGHGRVVGVLVHRCVLLAHSWSVWRASARWRRSRRSHSRSSMYRRMASRRNSLMVRPSSFNSCCTCSASSGGMEEVMALRDVGILSCLHKYDIVILLS